MKVRAVLHFASVFTPVLPSVLALCTVLCVASCAEEKPVQDPAPNFPEDYRASYSEVRGCRPSGDHDLNNIRILADPAALAPYMGRAAPFPVGSIVLKEEFDFADATCSGAITQWTEMTRLESGTSPTTLDWRWHQVDRNRKIVATDSPRCITCHTSCGEPPDGYSGTCAVP